MKQLVFFSLLLIFTAALSCGKDKDCPTGYTGDDCRDERTPTVIKVTKIQIQKFTTVKPNGAFWDPNDVGTARMPDILISIVRGGVQKYSASFASDCETAGAPYTISFANSNVAGSGEFRSDLSSQYTLRFYDYDYPSEELMVEMPFRFYTAGQGFPAKLKVESADGLYSCDLNLEYTFE